MAVVIVVVCAELTAQVVQALRAVSRAHQSHPPIVALTDRILTEANGTACLGCGFRSGGLRELVVA